MTISRNKQGEKLELVDETMVNQIKDLKKLQNQAWGLKRALAPKFMKAPPSNITFNFHSPLPLRGMKQ